MSHQEKDNLKSINNIQPEMGSPTNKVKERIERFSKGIYENEQVPPHESKTGIKISLSKKHGSKFKTINKAGVENLANKLTESINVH